jgi:hypothetical protein
MGGKRGRMSVGDAANSPWGAVTRIPLYLKSHGRRGCIFLMVVEGVSVSIREREHVARQATIAPRPGRTCFPEHIRFMSSLVH